jgi:hypothetical protein
MEHKLRRNVIWGPTIIRDNFPISITRSLKSHQTVFNIDHHWEALYHLTHPIFQKDEKTYVSFRITQSKDIDNYSVITFLTFLSEVEVFAEYCQNNSKWDSNKFDKFFKESIQNRKLSFKVKAQFMSEGEIDGSYEVSKLLSKALDIIPNETAQNIIIGASILTALFGNDVLGFPGILDVQTKQMIVKFCLERWIKRNGKEIEENLGLKTPSYDTKKIEAPKKEDQTE